MSRKNRISSTNSWYYVRNSVRAGNRLFREKSDVMRMIDLISEIEERFDCQIKAYALNSGVIQLVIHMNHDYLSDAMKHLSGVYTQFYNRKYQLNGGLFKGRYQSTILQPGKAVLWMTHIVHNAKTTTLHAGSSSKAQFVATPDINRQAAFHADASVNAWLSDYSPQLTYTEFLNKRVPTALKLLLSKATLPDYIGELSFGIKIGLEPKTAVTNEETHINVLDIPTVTNEVAEFFGLNSDDLYQKQTPHKQARNMAMMLSHYYTGKTLADIAKYFQIKHFASVSNRISHLRKQLAENKELNLQQQQLSQQLKTISRALTIGD